MTMANINKKVENRFNKRFNNNSYITEMLARYPVLASMIMGEMQEMYDLGHADGYAEAVRDYNEWEEENGNL